MSFTPEPAPSGSNTVIYVDAEPCDYEVGDIVWICRQCGHSIVLEEGVPRP